MQIICANYKFDVDYFSFDGAGGVRRDPPADARVPQSSRYKASGNCVAMTIVDPTPT